MTTLLGQVAVMSVDTHIAAITTTIVGTTVLVGALYRFVLLPNLRAELIAPVLETRQAVTQNGGKNDPPTVPDKLHALQASVDDLHATVTDLASSVAATAEVAADAARAAEKTAKDATAQRKSIDVAQTVLLQHITGHTHDED